ncbi:hypothetical protein B0I72DRAFT_176176 [Yarrowia lipolytica]|nr:hypothetical protein B0I72DRAFT_176176 [Yarrowia lipolytica]RDW39787.1 hypothetical protein B0I73DRAFT_174801 [Yarrowia lipolytica]RDW47169.1 hypothetical protein B0I74DRAFT_162981 [Yarrowia lipolytica]RDW53396.1 hypothetical protein B0I75DRAFT_168725 [Yarrowia lipolytica]
MSHHHHHPHLHQFSLHSTQPRFSPSDCFREPIALVGVPDNSWLPLAPRTTRLPSFSELLWSLEETARPMSPVSSEQSGDSCTTLWSLNSNPGSSPEAPSAPNPNLNYTYEKYPSTVEPIKRKYENSEQAVIDKTARKKTRKTPAAPTVKAIKPKTTKPRAKKTKGTTSPADASESAAARPARPPPVKPPPPTPEPTLVEQLLEHGLYEGAQQDACERLYCSKCRSYAKKTRFANVVRLATHLDVKHRTFRLKIFCDHKQCPRSIVGFASNKEKHEHLKHIHGQVQE